MKKKLQLLWLGLMTTLAQAQNPIHHFTFNNTMYNSNNSIVFGGNYGSTYVADRNGNPNSAKQLGAGTSVDYLEATIPNLPQGSAARSISMWVKFDNLQNRQFLYGYGSAASGQAYGLVQGNPGNLNELVHYGWGSDFTGAFAPSTGVWYNYTVTYSNSTLKAYVNGTQIISNTAAWNTSGTTFSVGKLINNALFGMNATIDDLKIFDFALSQSEVNTLAGIASLPTISSVNSFNTTQDATGIEYYVNPFGTTTTTLIRYGTDFANINLVQNGPSATGTGAYYLTQTLTGLQPGTTYYYRVEATNSGGTTLGSWRSFTTQANLVTAPTVTNFDITFVDSSSFQASYDLNANGGNTSVTFEVGQGDLTNPPMITYSGGSATGNTVQSYSTSYGLFAAQQSYWLRIIATNSAGVDTQSRIFTTTSKFAILGVNQSNITANSVTINFYVDSVGNAPMQIAEIVMNPGVEYDSDLDTQVYISNNPTLGANSIQVQNLLPNTTYSYRIGLGDFTPDIVYHYAEGQFTTNAMGVAQFENDFEMQLYPNPARAYLNIESVEQIDSIEIYNIQGQKIISSTQSKIDVSTLSSGMYLVRVQSAEGLWSTRKFSVE
ncbi:T9SS type A sorting domain-containing protein [Flavobacterium sp. CYK-55]|uniref:LamG-like jellyroll fold domain-containing protein n=1 Tax=Flavobacterium sp. CYK-55 TaxID=2835529 RepID=UPI001BCC9D9A|nr:LamG-like jellyroll fold domain-containing protein [Flavobacterium sp. CYK-55]MBS7786202.1 T9SS type A sorting domain-containing protein [Flavobacterium sp. CYK-55]